MVCIAGETHNIGPNLGGTETGCTSTKMDEFTDDQAALVKKGVKAFFDRIYRSAAEAHVTKTERYNIRYIADLTCTNSMVKNKDGTSYYTARWFISKILSIAKITRISQTVSQQYSLVKILQGLGDLTYEARWTQNKTELEFTPITNRNLPKVPSGIGKRLKEIQDVETQKIRSSETKQKVQEGDEKAIEDVERRIRKQVLSRVKGDQALCSSLDQIDFPYDRDYIYQTFKIMREYAPGTAVALLSPRSVTPKHTNQGLYIRFRELLREAKHDHSKYMEYKRARAAFDLKVKQKAFSSESEKHAERIKLDQREIEVEKGKIIEHFDIIELIDEYLKDKPPLVVTSFMLDQILHEENLKVQAELVEAMNQNPMEITEADIDELRSAIISIYLTIKRKTKSIQKAYKLIRDINLISRKILKRKKDEVEKTRRNLDNQIANSMKRSANDSITGLASAIGREKIGLLKKVSEMYFEEKDKLDVENDWHDRTVAFKVKYEGIVKEIEAKKSTCLYILKVIVTFGFVAFLTKRELNRAQVNIESAEKSIQKHEAKKEEFRKKLDEYTKQRDKIDKELQALRESYS